MANRALIKEMARTLNLHTIAETNLEERGMGNLDYLELVLSTEIDSRKQKAIKKGKKHCNLPNIQFDKERLNKGLQYKIEKLLGCEWIERSKNLLITGECGTGKTALATYLANNAIEKGHKVFYIKQDDLLLVIRHKEKSTKAMFTFNKVKNADLLVLDEVLYLNITKEDLELLYKTIMFLNDTASIMLITNREVSEWLEATEDKYAMQLLIKRAVENSEMIRLSN